MERKEGQPASAEHLPDTPQSVNSFCFKVRFGFRGKCENIVYDLFMLSTDVRS